MNPKKILVVDDEVDLVETVRFPLEMEGYHVLVSYNGEDALNQARKENPDLILLISCCRNWTDIKSAAC